MLVSPSPSCPSATSGSHVSRGPLNFTPLRPSERWESPKHAAACIPTFIHRTFTRPETKATAWQPTVPSTAARSHENPLRNANALPPAGGSHTASQQIPRLNCGRGAETSRSIFCLEPGLASRSLYGPIRNPRLGPPGASTSPESGMAVSRCVKFLSREKRKMWLTFSYHVYL
jgi:hypothetical protein